MLRLIINDASGKDKAILKLDTKKNEITKDDVITALSKSSIEIGDGDIIKVLNQKRAY